MSKEDKSKTHPMEPQRKRRRRPLIDAASVSDRVVLNVEDGSAGLRRQYPLEDAAKTLNSSEKEEPKQEKLAPGKAGSAVGIRFRGWSYGRAQSHGRDRPRERALEGRWFFF